MWENWKPDVEDKPSNLLKAEAYKDQAFIDIYDMHNHYEIICSVNNSIIFHTIEIANYDFNIAMKTYEDVKVDLSHIIDTTVEDSDERYDLCDTFINNW